MIRELGNFFSWENLSPLANRLDSWCHGCGLRFAGFIRAFLSGTDEPKRTSVAPIFQVFHACSSFLAMGVDVTPSTEGMIGLTNELHGVDTGPSKSDILRVSSQPHSACDLCDQSKQVLNL